MGVTTNSKIILLSFYLKHFTNKTKLTRPKKFVFFMGKMELDFKMKQYIQAENRSESENKKTRFISLACLFCKKRYSL